MIFCHIGVHLIKLCVKVALLENRLVYWGWRRFAGRKSQLILPFHVSFRAKYLSWALGRFAWVFWRTGFGLESDIQVFIDVSLRGDWRQESLGRSDTVSHAKLRLDWERAWIVKEAPTLAKRCHAKLVTFDQACYAHLSLRQFCIARISCYF